MLSGLLLYTSQSMDNTHLGCSLKTHECWTLYQISLNWSDAEVFCQEQNMTLAMLEVGDYRDLSQGLTSYSTKIGNGIWLGAKSYHLGSWKWRSEYPYTIAQQRQCKYRLQ